MITGHGGNIYQLAELLGCRTDEIIDMSSNINPLGPIPGLIPVLKKNLQSIRVLPEADAAGMVQAVAGRYGIPHRQIAAGTGTTQLIYALPHALKMKNALIIGPTYSDYADACKTYGVKSTYLFSKPADLFTPDITAIHQFSTRFDTIFICNPNNPTGGLLGRKDIETLCRICSHANVIVDESYLPFVDGWEEESIMRSDLPNAFVLHSLSKIFAVPGLRIGLIFFPHAFRENITRALQPWSVSGLAQVAARYIMENRENAVRFIEKSCRYITAEKNKFLNRFEGVEGIRFFPSRVGYLLARLSGRDSGTRLAD
ncbi:MAG: aminotransferase class I/II-fold pyridoxal phosphate-dependent enzyme, partial [Thermodesulfobacteriota bacterium]